jgi:signal transduction histidine kinase/DNA-binding NarL/FixJ family response regulator
MKAVMSVRLKVFALIASIVTVITVSVIAVSIFFSQTQVLRTVQKDMLLAVELADELVTHRINLLKADAALAASAIEEAPDDEEIAVMRKQMELYNEFLSLTVFNPSGTIAAVYGDSPTPHELRNSTFVQRAFAGEQVISTTRPDPTVGLVFHICVPMGYRVLSVTIPGLLFSDILSKFTIWESGNIFMLDRQGTVIASIYTDMVLRRHNFIEQGKTDPAEWGKMGAFFSNIIQGGKGVGTYPFYGEPRVCAYMPITDIGADWYIGIVAPMKESPATQIQQLLLLAAVLFFGLGMMAAFFASGSVARPYEQIQAQNVLLAELKEEALQSSEAKSRFLANMSHEMRTPLNAIIGLSELILGNGSPEDAGANLEKIYGSGIALLGIVNDLLDISKIESGKFDLVSAEYELPSLISDTINLNVIRIGSKPINFRLLVDETLPCRLFGDDLRIKQIFNNLLSNAFKYTDSGTVVWTISCQEEGGFVWLTSSVKDSGIGIKAEEKQKLFADYNRLDRTKTHRLEGTGLGLVIAKMIVDMMDGTIAVESEYGKGSTFTVKIKQKSLDAPPIGPAIAANLMSFRYEAQKRSSNAGLARMKLPYARILIVDDVPINLDVARGMLQPYDMNIDCVLGGRDAVEAIKKENPRYDAILMDHMMPDMDGIEAVRVIRKEIGTDYARTIPIIALTANAVKGSEERFLKAGFDDFLSKPIDIMRLDAVIHRWVRDTTKEKEYGGSADAPVDRAFIDKALAAINEPPEKRPIPVPGVSNFPEVSATFESWNIEGVDITKAFSRFGAVDSALLGAFRSYATHIGALVESLKDAETLADGADEERLKQYTVAVHSIKGASYGICADVVGKMAENLEKAARSGKTDVIAAENASLAAAVEKLKSELLEALEKNIS